MKIASYKLFFCSKSHISFNQCIFCCLVLVALLVINNIKKKKKKKEMAKSFISTFLFLFLHSTKVKNSVCQVTIEVIGIPSIRVWKPLLQCQSVQYGPMLLSFPYQHFELQKIRKGNLFIIEEKGNHLRLLHVDVSFVL